ncbi:hypothetical protein P4O66_007129, partial [Electrophorus voltai]
WILPLDVTVPFFRVLDSKQHPFDAFRWLLAATPPKCYDVVPAVRAGDLNVSVALNGHAGVHVCPGSGRATLLNSPPLACRSRSIPVAVCLRSFGQTPVSLASPLKGRDSGFSSAHWRAHWLHPTALLLVVVVPFGPPRPRLDSLSPTPTKKFLRVFPSTSGVDTDFSHSPSPNLLGSRRQGGGACTPPARKFVFSQGILWWLVIRSPVDLRYAFPKRRS